MAKKNIRRDPLEPEIEIAFSPGVFVQDRSCCQFVEDLQRVATRIGVLLTTDAARATGLLETFLAGCHEKAEELDDSSGEFNLLAKDLICRWVKARQMSGAEAGETATTLLAWMDDDPCAFCYEIERQLAEALNAPGLAAFERLIRARLDATPASEEYDRRRWADVLRAVYVSQRNAAAYQSLAEQIGTTPKDCLALATMFVSSRPGLALEWVERGIELGRRTAFGSEAGYGLGRLRRELLVKLGREFAHLIWPSLRI